MTFAVIPTPAKFSFRSLVLLSWALILPRSGGAQVSGQSFEVIPEVDSAMVGDSVSLRFRVRLDERDLLFDTVPQPLSAIPPGVRIISVEKLTRAPDRIFHGRARLAFYRTGRRAVPVFGLPFMRGVKGLQRGTLVSDSASVNIVSLLPAGNPSLKDIREIDLVPRRSPWPLAGITATALLLLAGYVMLRRQESQTSGPMEPSPAIVVLPPSAYASALDKLREIERAQWPLHGQVARHYEAIVDVLRGYLETQEGLPARERTTEELLWALPPHLGDNGIRDQLRELLEQADLVKFARLRPEPATAEQFLEHCRELLLGWQERSLAASAAADTGNALR